MPGPLTAFQTGVHGSRPANGAGCIVYSCTTHSLVYLDSGSAWSTWATLTGTGLTDPMTTRGDVIVRNSSNVSARLAHGSADTYLGSDGTDVAYSAVTDAKLSTSDITTNNASTSKHGFLKKLSNSATDYMDGTGAWSTPAGGGSGGSVPTVVQLKTSGTANNGTSLILDTAPVSGNVLVFGSVSNGNAGMTSIVQTNVTWTKMVTSAATASTKAEIWIGKASGSAGTTLALTYAGGNAIYSCVELTGVTVTPTVGVTAELVLGNQTNMVPVSLAATTADHLVVFVAGNISQNAKVVLTTSIPSVGVHTAYAAVGAMLSQGGKTFISIYSTDGAGSEMLMCEVT